MPHTSILEQIEYEPIQKHDQIPIYIYLCILIYFAVVYLLHDDYIPVDTLHYMPLCDHVPILVYRLEFAWANGQIFSCSSNDYRI